MALNRSISATQFSKKKIYLYEETGIYDASGNPNAWGSGTADPNPDISEVSDIGDTKGIVIMLIFDSGTYTWDDTTTIKARGWPNTSNQKLILEASNFGLESFPDGKVQIVTRTSGEFIYNDGSSDVTEGFSAEANTTIYLTKQVECCVENMAKAVTVEDINNFCNSVNVKRFSKADLLLRRIQFAALGNFYNEADLHLSTLQEFCQTEAGNCGC